MSGTVFYKKLAPFVKTAILFFMNIGKKRVLISVGEASGDLHAANLIKAVNKIDPNISFYGMGSELMKKAGAKLLVDSKTLSIIGTLEIITKFFKIWRALKIMKSTLSNDRPDLLILIDYPGFNLLLAKAAKKAGVKVLYYIAPKIWAWKRGRIKTIKNCVDMMAVIFPFEVEFYKNYQVPVTFVGNPLVDKLPEKITCEEARKALDLDERQITIGLFPGSRSSEIKRLLPIMLETAKILKDKIPGIQFVLPQAYSISESEFAPYLKPSIIDVKVIIGQNYNVMQACDAIIAASGTVTLEIALMAIPMVIIYKLNFIEYLLARILIKIPYVGLCNILSGKKIVKELLQNDAKPEKIAHEIDTILGDYVYHNNMIDSLTKMKIILTDGKKTTVASLVIQMVKRNAV